MIKYDMDKTRYYDKNGKEITEGCMIRYADGTVRKVYLTENDYLGTDATNPAWVKSGRAAECEYGVYPLSNMETEEVEVL